MLQKEDGLVVFVSAMDPFHEDMMMNVLRVVGGVCLVADGCVPSLLLTALYSLCFSPVTIVFSKQ